MKKHDESWQRLELSLSRCGLTDRGVSVYMSPGVTLTVRWPRVFLAIDLFSVSGIGRKCPSLRLP